MNRISGMEGLIINEHENLKKSISNVKTLDLVTSKKQELKDSFNEYKGLTQSLKIELIENGKWKKQVEQYEQIKLGSITRCNYWLRRY